MDITMLLDAARDVLSIVSVIATVITVLVKIPDAIRAIQELKNRKAEKPSFVNLEKSPTKNQPGDCDAVQYIAKRNWLILRAKQEAKKRPKANYVNLESILIITSVFCFWAWLWNFPPLPLIEKIADRSPGFLSVCNTIYDVGLVVGFIAYITRLLRMFFNVSTWTDLIKKGCDKCYICTSVREMGQKAAKKAKKAGKTAKEAKKEAIKEAKEWRVHISRVIDIASHFDTYLLFDADPCDADSRDAFLEDKVIGAMKINKDESIGDMIEPCLNEKSNKKLVVFIYSQHGRASYEQTKNARDKHPYVYDLGPVCGDMRDLEIVAHQLLYLQDEGCLKFPY